MNFDQKRNWVQDFNMENGMYLNSCSICHEQFIGHKRRYICRECDVKNELL